MDWKSILLGSEPSEKNASLQRDFKKEQVIAASLRDYSVQSYFIFFFILCAIGWLFEIALYLSDGSLINPGVLHGPWLPIYGFGGIVALVLLRKWRSRPAVTFFLIMLVCGIVEYATGWFLETFCGTRWWDHSGYPLNIQGFVCLESLLVFGVLGSAFIYILAPVLDTACKQIPLQVRRAVLVLLTSIFILDVGYSWVHPNYMAPKQNSIGFFSNLNAAYAEPNPLEEPIQDIRLKR